MKKVFFVLILAALSLSAYAQGWSRTEFAGDELKGVEAYTAYSFDMPGVGSFVFFDNEEAQYRLVCSDGIFSMERSQSYLGLQVTVGIYDDSDKLVDKFKMWLDALNQTDYEILTTRNAGTMFNPVGQKGKVKKILKCINGGKGYVRFLAPRYNKTEFDLKVYPIDIAH